MTVIARRVASTPERSASDTWGRIIELLAPDPEGDAARELARVSGVAATLVSSESMKNSPAVVFGSGPRVRIYCIHGNDAIEGDDVNEDPLPDTPTDGKWRMSLPCPQDDLDWVEAELKRLSTHVTARREGEPIDTGEANSESSYDTIVDRKAFLRP